MLRSRFPDIHIPDDTSLPKFILENAFNHGDHTAYVEATTGKKLSYREFFRDVRNVGSALLRRGLRPKDVLLICTPNSIAFPVIFYASLRIGVIITTSNPMCTSGEMKTQMQDAQVKYVLTMPEQAAKVDKTLKEYGNIKGKFIVGQYPGYTSFDDLLKDDGTCFREAVVNPKEDLCYILYSSGTTGPAKGVMLSHYNVLSLLQMFTHPNFSSAKRGKEVLMGYLPFYHNYGIMVSMLMSVLLGETTIILPKFSLKLFLESCEKYKVTWLSLVPPTAILLSKHPMALRYNLDSIHTVYLGAAPFGVGEARELVKVLKNASVKQGYGMTEGSGISHLSPVVGAKEGSVGVLFPNLECKVIDVDTGAILGKNQPGEICVRGTIVMRGYLNKPEMTAQTIDSEGWLHSGDIGYYDDDEYFYIVDRLKELIKYKGLQVPPAEIETVILTHPGIADVGVVGVPDAEAGELPRAYVVKKAGVRLTEQDVSSYVAEHLSPHKRLRGGVVFLEEIPKSLSGKILRRKLKEMSIQKSKL